MMGRGMAFWRGYNVEIISKIFLEQPDPVAGFTCLAEKIKGAYSLVILTRDGMYATRDIYGFRPLILGQGKTRSRLIRPNTTAWKPLWMPWGLTRRISMGLRPSHIAFAKSFFR